MSPRNDPPGGLVTFLFTDIEGSTRLVQMLGAEYRQVLHAHRRVLREALSTADGFELFTEGDSLFVAFPDAATALRACARAQRALADHHWPAVEVGPRVRMGLHTGYAVPVAGEYASAEVHRAARVASAAHGGQVLCSASTARVATSGSALPDGLELHDLGLHKLRGFDGRERLFQLVAPDLDRWFPRPRTDSAPAHNLPAPPSSFVGRDSERGELRRLVAEARIVPSIRPATSGRLVAATRPGAGHRPAGRGRTAAGTRPGTAARPCVASQFGTQVGGQIATQVGGQHGTQVGGQLVARNRLVTVVGPGGAGKTRLAVEVAGDLVGQYRDGVWFADLSTAATPAGERSGQVDPEAVAATVAVALGVRAEPGRPIVDTMADHLTNRQVLLVLDTCESDVRATRELVGRLLAAAPSVSVLATSREPIGAPGEVVWRIPPLRLVASDSGGSSEAVALLAERAAAARGGLPTSGDEIPALQRVAAALGGLPLALELAAARLRVLTADQLAARFEAADRVEGVLAMLDAGAEGVDLDAEPGSRHRTLAATVAWSYRTLDERSARLLRRLSVFNGPVDLAAIEWMHGDDPLGPLVTLVDKSLLQVEQGRRGATYRMIDPIRAYAARALAEAGEESAARDRHVAWCLRAVDLARAADAGRCEGLSLYRLDPLTDEVRAALRWTATGGSPRRGLTVATALDPWWRERGRSREGRAWLFRLYERIGATGERLSQTELAQAYHVHALLAGADGEYAEELRFAERAEDAALAAGDLALLTRVRSTRPAALIGLGRLEEAERACRDVLAEAQRGGVAGDALHAGYALAILLWRRGDLAEAADLLATARPIEAVHPAERARRTVDMALGLVALSRRDLVAAHEHLVVALRSRMRHGFHARASETLNAVAVRCALGGEPETAARLFGAAQAARAELGCAPSGFGPFWVKHNGLVRQTLGDAGFDAAYAAGGALSLSEAVALALGVEHPDLALESCRL